MALGTDGFTGGNGGDLTVSIPLKWGQQINDYFRYNLTLAAFFIDRSDELADGAAVVYTPNLSALSTNTKTVNAQITLSSPTYTNVTLTVSTWREASFVIEDREAAQVKKSYYIQDKIAKGAAWEVAEDLENAIAALFTGFTTNVVGLGNANIADSSLLAAIAIMETAGVPGVYEGDVAWIMHPNTFFRQVGNIDKMTLWQNTSTELPRAKAPTRALYSIPVIVSPAVPVGGGAVGDNGARLNLLAHKDAIHWARLSMPVKSAMGMVGTEGVRVQQSYVHEYLGDLVTVDLCYGVVENRDDAAVKIRSHSIAVGL
jgi:hypothetical protein